MLVGLFSMPAYVSQASVATAVEAARRELTASTLGGAGVVCVCGSLHAVAEALQTLALEN